MPIPARALLYEPILKILTDRKEHPSWEIEDKLAKLFHVTGKERAIPNPNSPVGVFRNTVAFAFNHLVYTNQIINCGKRKSPDGGYRAIYRLPI